MSEEVTLQPKKRIDYFDIAKGIAIICVIIGHTNIYFSRLNSAIFSFHMPVFFMISGYFLSTKLDFKAYAQKKAKQLFPPYIFTGLILVLTSIPIALYIHSDVIKAFLKRVLAFFYGAGTTIRKPFLVSQIGAIWFFLALFVALLIVRYFIHKKNGPLIIVLLALIGYFSAYKYWLPLSIQAGMTASLFVMLGYYAKKHNVLNALHNKLFMVVITAFSLIVFVINIIFNGKLYMVKNYYQFNVFTLLVAVCGTILVILLSRLISKTKIPKKILTFYGKNSMVILCVHLIEMDCLPWRSFRELLSSHGVSEWLRLLILVILKIIISTIAVFIVLKIPPIARIFNINAKPKEKVLA